jgi:hypothetical protein
MDAETLDNMADGRSWVRDAEALGFAARDGAYRLNGTCLRLDRGWLTLTAGRPEAKASRLGDQLGRPGLWRTVLAGCGRHASVQQVWELPPLALQVASEDAGGGGQDAPRSAVQAALSWALATAEGHAPEGWRGPPLQEVEAVIPPGAMTVRKGALMCQGTLICTPDRLAVVFPVLSGIPADLPAWRRKWLDAVLADAQTQWRLVRLGVAGANGSASVQAEVDLTGVPPALVEAMVKSSLAALQWVVQWLLRSADFIVDTRVASKALESA